MGEGETSFGVGDFRLILLIGDPYFSFNFDAFLIVVVGLSTASFMIYCSLPTSFGLVKFSV